MLLIEHKIWHGISPEGYRQVFTKINQNYICQQGNIFLDNLRFLNLVRMSRSHVKGHRRGGVCVLRMFLVVYHVVLVFIAGAVLGIHLLFVLISGGLIISGYNLFPVDFETLPLQLRDQPWIKREFAYTMRNKFPDR